MLQLADLRDYLRKAGHGEDVIQDIMAVASADGPDIRDIALSARERADEQEGRFHVLSVSISDWIRDNAILGGEVAPITHRFSPGGGFGGEWVVYLTGDGGGSIETTGVKEDGDDPSDLEYNSAIDGLESLVLAHAMMGIDVVSPEYQQGLWTALQAIGDCL